MLQVRRVKRVLLADVAGLVAAGEPADALLLSERKPDCRVESSGGRMKPTASLRDGFSVFATTPCRGLSLSR